MKKFKILHVFNELKYSGAEIMYVDAAKNFQEKGCDLNAIATGKELGDFAPFFINSGYKVYHKPIPPLKNYINRIRYYYYFIKFLRNEKIELIHIHSSKMMWGGAFCSWYLGIKSIYTFHNVFPSRPISYLYHVLLRLSAKKIFQCKFHSISDSVYDHELKFYLNKTKKIYNWYSHNRFYPAIENEKEKARLELNIPLDSLVLISIGGCSPIKSHSEIIKAIPIVFNQFHKLTYLHLGNGKSEIQEKELAKKLGVLESIIFCGNQKDVRKFLIASDIYLMTSKFEGIPITTIEAMACKIPSILYDVPGLRDFNSYGLNSIQVDPDFIKLADKIIELRLNNILTDQIIKNAYNFVNSKFSLEVNADKIFQLYTSG